MMNTPPHTPPRRFSEDTSDVNADSELQRQQAMTRAQKAKVVAKQGASVGWIKGKKGFDWMWQKSGILGEWMNKQAGKMGMEAFWPTSMDKEITKCARILWTFSQTRAEPPSATDDPHAAKKTQKVIKKIPAHIIEKAEGLAIFTVFRTGLGWSAASGSGIVIARDSPTSWGPPSGLLVHTIGFGFLAGIDVYDAVLVLRTKKAVDAFAKAKVSLGAELAVVAGPVGNGASLEMGLELAPILSYTKSKGVYGGLQLDGTVIIERGDENARFYKHPGIKARKILEGGAVPFPAAAAPLLAVIAASEGKRIDPSELPDDVDIAPSDQSGGVGSLEESRRAAAMARTSIASEGEQDSPQEMLKPRPKSESFAAPPRPPRRFVAPRPAQME